MLVDKILEYYGDNPAAYVSNSDKWISASAAMFVSSFIYFPIFFALLALLYLFIKRKEYTKDKKKFILRIFLYPIAGAIVGCVVLYLLLGIIASLGVRSYYAG